MLVSSFVCFYAVNITTSFKTHGLVRDQYFSTVELTQLREGETKVDYLIQLDNGESDNDGKYLMSQFLLKNLKSAVEMQQYFQQLRPLDVLDEKDGEAIAEIFMLVHAKSEKEQAMISNLSLASIRVNAVISSH